jgi:hypothetical protein
MNLNCTAEDSTATRTVSWLRRTEEEAEATWAVAISPPTTSTTTTTTPVVVEATEPDAANGWDWDGWNPKPGLCRHKRAESGPLSLCRMTPAGRR